MSIDCSYKDIDWCHISFFKSSDCISDTSIIVPDSLCDIAKIISVKAYPSVSESKAEAGHINISGQIKYNVLYIGEDENSTLCSITSTAPFSHSIAANVTDDYITTASVSCVSADCSIINSRKIKATTLVKLCAKACKNNRLKVLSSARGTQTKLAELDFTAASCICRKSIPVTETALLPSGKGVISSILKSDAKITDYEYKILNNKAIIKGNALVTVLYLSEGSISEASVTVSFTEVTEAEGLSPDKEAKLTLTLIDCDVSPDTDLSGDYRMLDISLLLNADIMCLAVEKVNAVTDIYLPHGAIKTENTARVIQSLPCEYTKEEHIGETITLNKGMPPIVRVLSVDSVISDVSYTDTTLSLVAEVTVLYFSDDTSLPINSVTTKIPVTHNHSETDIKNLSCTTGHISYTLSGDNCIEIRLSVNFNVTTAREENVTLYTMCEEAEYTPPSRPSIIISYVNKGDSLWDIAKKYNISLSLLASANALSEDSILTVGEKLIIPR